MRNTPASTAERVSQSMSWDPNPWRRCSMRSRDISAISRVSIARAKPRYASSDTGLLTAAIAVGGEHQLVSVAQLERRMARIRHDAQVRLRPCAVQIPCAGCGADDVIAPLHDGGRYI